MTVLVTDGHLPFPYGHETTGYQVSDLAATLDKAKANGATVLVNAYSSDKRQAAMVEFPGGYVAEIHSLSSQ
jgi:predicted enzyme related to lactoylglutathione lyase